MNNHLFLSLTIALLSLVMASTSSAYSGLATHDQNSLLIPYWIPHTIEANGKTGVQTSTSLFITNTLHNETKANETLVIDAETYRFDLNLQYETSHWVYHVNIPFISSSGGSLDDIIINYHDALGFPQGGRLEHANDQLNIQYQRNNKVLVNTQNSYNGLGDISIVMVRSLYQNSERSWNLGFGLNVPTGDSNELISNDKVDSSAWLSYHLNDSDFFATLGVIKPGKGGVLNSELKSSVIFAQTGYALELNEKIKAQIQFDYHSSFIETKTDALGDSLQIQLGLNFSHFESADVQLFFSEDISVGSAPDITFGLQIDWLL